MNLNWKYFFLLFLSFLISFLGLYLLNNAYYKKLGTISVISEINFLKEMPFLLNKQKINTLPIGHENLILKNNPLFNLKASVKDFNNKSSIYDVDFILNYQGKELLKFSCLIDARLRK